jgi:hypothetical protein
MNIINIIKGIEQLAVELLLWIIYVPKTLYKIIKDPNWVPVYIKEELNKDEDKFKGYLSPILLFLAISVLLFVLLDSGLIIAPDYDESGGNFGQKLQGPAGLLFLALPLFFGLTIELFRKGGIKRENLLHSLYVQCYFFSPLMLSFFAYMLADQFDWGNIKGDTYLSMVPLLMFLLTLLWFIIIQVKYISRELRYKKWISLGLHLLCYIIIGIGLETYYVLTPHEVDDGAAGEPEQVLLKLPEQGEYQLYISADNWDSISNYTISSHIGPSEVFIPSKKMTLIHNQVVVGQVQDKLLFTFKGNEGDQIVLLGSASLLNSLGTLSFDAYINPNKSLMYDYSLDSKPKPTGVWSIEPMENNEGFILYINLPKTGVYDLIIYDLQNDGRPFRLGYYKNDIYGNTEDTGVGKLVNGTQYGGTSLLEQVPFDRWVFTGSKNEERTIILVPNEDAKMLDLSFNVVNAKQESIVPVDRKSIADIIHGIYVVLFGSLIVIGYRALFRKSEEIQVSDTESGKKVGKTVAIIGLIIALLMVLFFLTL